MYIILLCMRVYWAHNMLTAMNGHRYYLYGSTYWLTRFLYMYIYSNIKIVEATVYIQTGFISSIKPSLHRVGYTSRTPGVVLNISDIIIIYNTYLPKRPAAENHCITYTTECKRIQSFRLVCTIIMLYRRRRLSFENTKHASAEVFIYNVYKRIRLPVKYVITNLSISPDAIDSWGGRLSILLLFENATESGFDGEKSR